MRKVVAVAAALATCSVSLGAFAQEPPPPPPPTLAPPPPPEARPAPPEPREGGREKEFGNPGVIAIGGSTSANFGWTQDSPPAGGKSTSAIDLNLQPDIQYFVIEGLSVGGTLLFDWTKPNSGDATTTFGIGPTVGYNIWLSPGSLSLWPQVTFLFNTKSEPTGQPAPAPSSVSLTTMTLQAFVPLLIHPVSHFHFGVGPYVSTDLSSKASAGGQSADGDKFTSVGIRLEVAGWL
ncbi:MAG TPA: hypothetical protein VGG39_17220 [Polyangiaceae bacterium]|jgi:hypothetical protein